MAANYAPPQDDPGSYATLPGTSGVEFVQHIMTPMKSHLEPGREVAGCHPSRWIHELLNNNFTVCDIFDRARQINPETPQTWEHPHRLVINGNQSFKAASTQTLSAVCQDCHFHFVFKMHWEEEHSSTLCSASKSGWPLRDDAFPWHHLVWVGSDSDEGITRDRTQHYPLLARENFVCSAPPCTFDLVLEISEPRMPSTWIQLLQDHAAIREQLELAKAQDPDRYEGANEDWIRQGPLNLNTYLKNQLEANLQTTRSISKRNKRFSVLFGPRCFPIFRGLQFEETVVDSDGVDEGSFTPPAPDPAEGPSGTTELGTYRAFIEDVRAEIQSLIHKAGLAMEKPTFCASSLYADMGSVEVPDISSNALVNAERYKLLGILPTQSREIVVNAYKRQWDLMPSRRKDLVEALMAVANDSQDELLSDYAITQSSVFDSQPLHQTQGDGDGMISQSLDFLGLRPPNNYTADAIIHAFRKKLAADPGDASTARNVLMWIAQSSDDDMYQASLLMETDTKMSLDTAKAVLGVGPADDIGSATVETTREKLKASPNKDATGIYLDALDSIAEHTASLSLKQAVMELRHAHSEYGSGGMAQTSSTEVNYEIPVGLDNIGNTCYLNSLLQYLYTVKPVRDVVLNYGEVELGLSDDDIQRRLIGGNKMQMDRGEAVVANAFAQELAKLFDNLHSSDKTATRPSQRLANAVLLSTHTLLNSAKQQPDKAEQIPLPPVLPSEPPTVEKTMAPTEQTQQADTIMGSDKPELETASVASTETLVDAGDAETEPPKVQQLVAQFEKQRKDDDASTDVAMNPTSESLSVVEAGEIPRQAIGIASGAVEDKPSPDVVMSDIKEPETVDQQVLNALEHQKRSSGTDQQDVEEVMGSIINRLQAAIRPTSVEEKTGIQLEKIMETFFVTTINYTKKFDETEYQQEVSFDRSITAFPATDGPCSLYDALGRNFDQQILEESKLSRYTAIKTLPPVLHILIQRTQSNGSKNGNAVIIPETLYVDRYMDTPQSSLNFQRRVEDWVTTNRVADLKAQLAKSNSNPSYLKFLENYGRETADSETTANLNPQGEDTPVMVSAEETWDFDGPVEDDFVLVSSDKTTEPKPAEKMEPVRDIVQTHSEIRSMMERELQEHEKTLTEHFDSQRRIPYRLHAVICHRGHLMSGHYWVWIHDFEENVWRWYNDADVKENKNTGEVLQTLSTGGEPYFLCYVRDDDKDTYVSVPKRERPPTPPPPSPPEATTDSSMAEQPAAVEESTTTADSAKLAGSVDADGDVDVVGNAAEDATHVGANGDDVTVMKE